MKFLADVMMGKLGRWMRMMGYDTEIASDELSDSELVEKAEEEDRVILTRDVGVSKRNTDVKVLLLRKRDFEEQIRNVFSEFGLDPKFPEESRCSNCNGELLETGENKWICKECGQRYWKGSHWKRIKEVKEMLGN